MRLSIPTRIFIGFVCVLSALGVLAAISLQQHQRTAKTLRLLHSGYLPLAITIGEARATQAVFRTLLERVLDEANPKGTQNWLNIGLQVRPVTLARAQRGLNRIDHLHPPQQELAKISTIRHELRKVEKLYRDNAQRFRQLFEALEHSDRQRALEIVANLKTQERAIQRSLRRAWANLHQQITISSVQADEQEQRTAVILALLTISGLILGVAITWWSSRILAPLPKLQQRVAAVARGDYSAQPGVQRDDEIGKLSNAFDEMVSTLAARERSLRETTDSLRNLQNLQQNILSELNAAVVLVDSEDHILLANPAAEKIWHIPNQGAPIQVKQSAIFAQNPELYESVQRTRLDPQTCRLTAVQYTDQDTTRFFNIVVTAFELTQNNRPGALLVGEDVTEELQAKNRLIQTERLAAIGQMAAHVSHEVRNPLSSIALNVDMLEEDIGNGANEDLRATLGSIRNEVERLTRVTEQYLRLAKVPNPTLHEENIVELVQGVVELLAAELKSAGVKVQLHAQQAELLVLVDETQLRQALINLIRNAKEAMSTGGLMDIYLQKEEENIVVRVRDQGLGIADKDLSKVFDLFYTTKSGGSGLGLPLTQQIIIAHKGSIRCFNNKDCGSTFELTLPAALP